MAAWAVIAVSVPLCAEAGRQSAAVPPPPLSLSRLADPESSSGHLAPARLPGRPVGVQQVPLQPLPVTRLEEAPRAASLDASRAFSLRIGEPQPIQELLLLLVRDTPFSIVAAPGVEGAFVGELKDVSLREALDLVLGPLDLAYEVDRRFIRVFPRRTETRLFDVAAVQTVRTSRRALGTASADRSWSVESSDAADFFEELAEGVRTLLSASGRFNLDRKAGLLQVTDYPDRLDGVAAYLEAVERRVTRQVEIRALVAEVSLDSAHTAGVDWGEVVAALGLEPAAAHGGHLPGLDLSDPAPLLAALAAQGRVRVLASPRVVTMNNEPVFLRVGREDGFVRPFGGGGAAAATMEAADARGMSYEGMVLAVTPQIAADGMIQMSVSPSLTERSDESAPAAGSRVTVREADAMVGVRSGETAVISGLLQAGPGRQTDLVVLLRPAIVGPGSAPGW